MKTTTLTYCGECQRDFEGDEVVWFAWIENRCFCSTCKSKLQIQDWEQRKAPGLVEKTVDLVNELHVIAQENRFSFIIDGHSEPSVQLVYENFFSLFKNFDIHETNDGKFPYQLINEVEGVVFFTFVTQAEYEKYVLREVV